MGPCRRYLTATGNTADAEMHRRRSSAAFGASGRFVFMHLRIQDGVLDLLNRDDARRLHEACAKTLEGVVDLLQLAMHNEQAGIYLDGARQFFAHGQALQAQTVGVDTVGVILRRALACVRKASPSEQSEKLEARALLMLFGTWTLVAEEMDTATARCGYSRRVR